MKLGDTPHASEVVQGTRFQFGRNWETFLQSLNYDQVVQAEQSLKDMLRVDVLKGKTFLDIGSGSGLFSLAARRLGATVVSFDYDPDSVACTNYIKMKYFPQDADWVVHENSVLNEAFLCLLGKFDVVYSWGVLHHTGNLWQAIDNSQRLVAPNGKLFLAIYNDQGRRSAAWKTVKASYCIAPRLLRPIIVAACLVVLWGPATARDILTLSPFKTWRTYSKNRGMSPLRDVIDWVGGLPFEVAKPEQVFRFLRDRGFGLEELTTCAGKHGCNQFVFCASGRKEVDD